MKIISTSIPEVKIIEPKVFKDSRGYFFESYNKKKFDEEITPIDFIQDNESQSEYGVLRGLHYQIPPFTQSKLVRVISGKVLDIVVDIRKSSPCFGELVVAELSAENKRQLFIPRGFAHGFVVLSEKAIFYYKVDNYYSPKHERGILFNDPELSIDWKLPVENFKLSEKDIKLPKLKNAELFE